MSLIQYAYKLIKGLPTCDSIQLIQAKRHQVSCNQRVRCSPFGLTMDEEAMLSSSEVEERASQIYKEERHV